MIQCESVYILENIENKMKHKQIPTGIRYEINRMDKLVHSDYIDHHWEFYQRLFAVQYIYG